MKNYDTLNHVQGKSLFIDDFAAPNGTLNAYIFTSPIAHGKIINLDISEAEEFEGVVKIITADDIPGVNQIGNIVQDEVLLAEDEVDFIGQPIAIIVSDSNKIGKAASELIKIDFEELPVITNPREAFKQNSLIVPPVTFESGNIGTGFEQSDFVIEGKVENGGQEHLYLETQGAFAIPQEGSRIKIISSTQSPTAVQRVTSGILGISMNNVEVDVLRLGGGFGGKEDQATVWAALAALSSFIVKQPVKLVLSRHEDLFMTGKRHAYSSDYKIGLSKDGRILAYEVTFYQNAGAAADLSTAVLERTLFHATNSYFIPNVKATGISCKTNLPPNTAFRGFGGPQGMFVIESALYKASKKLNIPYHQLQRNNLLKENDSFYYGQVNENSQLIKCWDEADKAFNISKLNNDVNIYNSNNQLFKKGIAVMPITFGISFTSSFLNQASALVHIYTDGSIGISTAAVEMGQGVNEKLRRIAAETFSIDINRIKIETTNTTRAANTSPTAASSAADLNGNALLIACNKIKSRLLNFAKSELCSLLCDNASLVDETVFIDDKKSELDWEDLISRAYMARISLSAQAFYATPKIYFDRETNQGRPFAYHVYGTAIIISKLDVLRGTYEIESVKVVHDFGKSIAKEVDLGQMEGGIVQGIGWLTSEDLRYDEKGRLLSNTLSTYKVPDIYAVPKNIEVNFLENSTNDFGPLNSKAIGEPPLMYGIGAYFSILNAMEAACNKKDFEIISPLTPERVLMNLYANEEYNQQAR